MCPFSDWCDEAEESVGDHSLKVLTGVNANLVQAVEAMAGVVPTHYASEERVAGLLERLGKTASAEFIKKKLPEGPRIRSGDLGEIIATEYVSEQTTFTVPIKRLRWKDHRNMAMRGDDVIGVRKPEDGSPLEFSKAESKSNATLAQGVVTKARIALNKDDGLSRTTLALRRPITEKSRATICAPVLSTPSVCEIYKSRHRGLAKSMFPGPLVTPTDGRSATAPTPRIGMGGYTGLKEAVMLIKDDGVVVASTEPANHYDVRTNRADAKYEPLSLN